MFRIIVVKKKKNVVNTLILSKLFAFVEENCCLLLEISEQGVVKPDMLLTANSNSVVKRLALACVLCK